MAFNTIAHAADPLPSWNDGKAKQSIINFVTKVTTPGTSHFVPVAEHIATFDNDGTLLRFYCENVVWIWKFAKVHTELEYLTSFLCAY